MQKLLAISRQQQQYRRVHSIAASRWFHTLVGTALLDLTDDTWLLVTLAQRRLHALLYLLPHRLCRHILLGDPPVLRQLCSTPLVASHHVLLRGMFSNHIQSLCDDKGSHQSPSDTT